MIDLGRVETLSDGLVFPEGPRWRMGRLWFSDMEAQTVCSVDMTGNVRQEVELDDYPSGIGWLPDGTLLVVSMKRQRVLAAGADGRTRVHADLSATALCHANDMTVDDKGRAYVGSMGYDIWQDTNQKPGNLCMIMPDGTVSEVARNLSFPNGAVITPDGETLIVAESTAMCLTAFSISTDGKLSGRRNWASTGTELPDGICLDEAGGIWIACITTRSFLRFQAGGLITHCVRIPEGRAAWAVMLGGPNGQTLFLLTSSPLGDSREHRLETRPGRIEMVRAPYPRSGLP